MSLAHSLRPATAEEYGFVIKPWLQELRDLPTTRWISDAVFFQGHGRVISALLQNASVVVACDPEAHGHLYGYACFTIAPPTLHWLYVKSTFRRMGIGGALLRHVRAALSLSDADSLALSHPSAMLGIPGLRERMCVEYNPYVLMDAAA
jgi:GNAT superfamily N-acetyltransferase